MSLKLFTVNDGNIVINKIEVLAIESFRLLINKYKSDKTLAFKELAYIWYVYDYDSPLNRQGRSVKDASKLAIEKVGLPIGWKPDDITNKAIKDYVDLNNNIAKDLVNEILKIFSNYAKIIKKVGKTIDTLLDNDAALTKTQASELIELSSSIISISKQVPQEVKNLKEALAELNKDIDKENYDTLRGSTEVVPDSADPDRDW
jgi:hypothetical protein